MEMLNCAKGATLNFNLRAPRSKRPTNLYAVVKVSGKQIKIPTTAKICSYLWNSKKQLPIFPKNMSDVDRNNALFVSNIIFLFQKTFSDFYLYLCSRNEVITTKEVRDYFTENVLSKLKLDGDMARNGVPNVKHEKKATKALNKALDLYSAVKSKPVKKSSLETYKNNLSNFIEYCEEIKRDSILMLTEKGINEYEIYLRNKNFSSGTIRASLRIVRILINDVIVKHPYFKSYGIIAVNIKLPVEIRSEGKRVELTDDEIQAISNCEGLTKKEQEYRDLFLLECLTGQRVSDIPVLFNPERYTIKDNFISFLTQKEGVPALVERTPEVLKIIERYKQGFNEIDIVSDGLPQRETRALKRIAEKAGLNRIISYKDNYGKVVNVSLNKIISSHYGRHTFVTRMARKVDLNKLKFLTGHKDIQALQKYYLHQTDEDRINLVNEALNGNKGTTFNYRTRQGDSILNELFAYDSFVSIMGLLNNNIDVFHLNITKQAMDIVKDVSRLVSYSKESNVSKSEELEQVIFELSYYFRDTQLYSSFKYKENYFGMNVNVPSTEDVEIMFAQEDIERPKKQIQADIDAWENR